MISGFRREVDENCSLVGYDAASSGSSLPTFGDNLSGSHLQGSRIRDFLRMGPICFPETSVKNCHCSLRNSPEERSSQLHKIVVIKEPSFCAVITSDCLGIRPKGGKIHFNL